MHANQTDIQRIFGGVQQYVIPLFQRPYSWDTKQWSVLWNDLVELVEDETPRSHFIGSIVTIPARSVPEGVAKFVLIDGQQRLTTLLILLSVIREHAKKHPGDMATKIEKRHLKNDFEQGTDAYKLLPTQVDRQAFFALIDGVRVPPDSKMGRAFAFFDKKLKLFGEPEQLDKLYTIIVKNLVLVSIVLDKDDNPYLIFESLNAKGERLTQADLIRNYFFMRIHTNVQDKMFDDYWKPMQESMADFLTEFIRHFLMRNGKNVRQGDIYYTLKDGIEDRSSEQVIDYLKEVARFSKYYGRLLDPDQEESKKLSVRMKRLNRFEATTAYPFLLNIYHDYSNKKVSENDFAAILDVMESFLIRRYVCNVPTNALSRIFIALYGQIATASNMVDGVKSVLSKHDFPRDKQFREQFITHKLYGGGDRLPKAKLILERMELSFEHKEPIDIGALTIEHVMPQTPSDWWKENLGEDWEITHATWIDTVGNLTLTGYNPSLSNAEFPKKKSIYATSHVELSRYFKDIDVWDEQAMAKRGEILADRATAIWPDFSGRDALAEVDVQAEEEVQEDVKLLVARVIEHFRGEKELLGSGPRYICRVGDGKVINVKYSKRHSDYYWFGMHASLWDDIGRLGVTHIVFILVPSGFLTVPVALMKDYIIEAGISPKSDGSVRHYHILIAPEPKIELFHHGKTNRIPVKEYYVAFD